MTGIYIPTKKRSMWNKEQVRVNHVILEIKRKNYGPYSGRCNAANIQPMIFSSDRLAESKRSRRRHWSDEIRKFAACDTVSVISSRKE